MTEETQTNELPTLEANNRTYLFMHKTIRRYRVGRFEFKNNYLRLNSAEDRQEFLDILNQSGFPKRDAIQIVEVNEEARAQTESSVVRGNMAAGDILTGKDHQRLLALQNKPGSTGGALAPNPGKPQGFNIAGLNLGGKTQ